MGERACDGRSDRGAVGGAIYGVASPDGGHMFTQWHGHSLTLPVTSSAGGGARSDGGLLLQSRRTR